MLKTRLMKKLSECDLYDLDINLCDVKKGKHYGKDLCINMQGVRLFDDISSVYKGL